MDANHQLTPNLGVCNSVAAVTVTSASTAIGGPQAVEVTGQISGATALMDALRRHGVDTIFGYPGGAILPIYDALHIAES